MLRIAKRGVEGGLTNLFQIDDLNLEAKIQPDQPT